MFLFLWNSDFHPISHFRPRDNSFSSRDNTFPSVCLRVRFFSYCRHDFAAAACCQGDDLTLTVLVFWIRGWSKMVFFGFRWIFSKYRTKNGQWDSHDCKNITPSYLTFIRDKHLRIQPTHITSKTWVETKWEHQDTNCKETNWNEDINLFSLLFFFRAIQCDPKN